MLHIERDCWGDWLNGTVVRIWFQRAYVRASLYSFEHTPVAYVCHA
jgi:hypothetical protein